MIFSAEVKGLSTVQIPQIDLNEILEGKQGVSESNARKVLLACEIMNSPVMLVKNYHSSAGENTVTARVQATIQDWAKNHCIALCYEYSPD